MMSTDEKFQIFFEYRYLIDKVLQKYSPDKPDYEELYDAGISGLMKAIDSYRSNIKQMDKTDLRLFVLFHIKSEINEVLNNKD